VAYSEDLVTWRPQDYPRMNEKGCKEPIVFAMDDGTFDIYFKSNNGKRYVQASNDFRHFVEDSIASTIDDIAWVRDTATINNKLREGNQFDVPKVHLDYIINWFAAMNRENELNRETMKDDDKRFAHLPETMHATLNVDMNQQKAISDKLVGIFFEDISYAADGGLYAELVQNRDFEYRKGEGRGKEWGPSFAWHFSKNVQLSTDNPLSANNPNHITMEMDTICNDGWDGIMDEGAMYDFSVYVRNIDCQKKKFNVALVNEHGIVLAEGDFTSEGQGWKQYKLSLNTDSKKRAKMVLADVQKCQLRIIGKKKGRVALDMISLFPHDTFKGHGLRKDLAETIAALKPKFVRFPGGCMSHGEGIDNIYHWNHTVGPWQDRKPDFNIWHYHQTRGLGFYEYFQFCEDIGAEPLPVLAAGVPCQNSGPNAEGYGGQQGGIPMEEMPAYIDELCNMIEWANGDPATNKWAKMRADAGHPAPFNLKYIGIGNEDIISTTFEERCEMICKAIKQRYPNIIVCGTVGPFHYPSSDYIEGWKFAKENKQVIDMVDEHYYESTGWFMHHLDYYDEYDRQGPKVYIGEYASRTRTVESALAEALFLCHVERNADIVEMTSYAPLLAKDGHHNWNPDLIYFNNTDVTLTPSYVTQQLFSTFSGNRYITSEIKVDDAVKHRVAASVVKDNKTGKTYLKLVNALPVKMAFDVKGLQLPTTVKYQGFEGKPAETNYLKVDSQDDHSSVPLNIKGSVITLPPYSMRAIEW
ncbi:MAG: alpha-N-arabinofuranosidase, partial [Prevotella sp.]|nr:alpha-N-arabinofuranosidase [Prevotella sp.]